MVQAVQGGPGVSEGDGQQRSLFRNHSPGTHAGVFSWGITATGKGRELLNQALTGLARAHEAETLA